jgi:hypothetical protein
MKNNYRLESRMRENRPCGSEGGEGQPFRTPIRGKCGAVRADQYVTVTVIVSV